MSERTHPRYATLTSSAGALAEAATQSPARLKLSCTDKWVPSPNCSIHPWVKFAKDAKVPCDTVVRQEHTSYRAEVNAMVRHLLERSSRVQLVLSAYRVEVERD